MSQQELLARVVKVLEDAGVSYMLTGSVVSSLQGEPRSTHDIDIVVAIRADQVAAIASAFSGQQYAFDDVAAREAVTKQDMFQLTDFDSGDKIDFWVLTDNPFDRHVFSRRHRQTIVGVSAYIPRPEDTILRKLLWAREYESERQYRDALGVYELQFGSLDMEYLRHWVRELALEQVWQRMLSEADPLDE